MLNTDLTSVLVVISDPVPLHNGPQPCSAIMPGLCEDEGNNISPQETLIIDISVDGKVR